MGKLDELRRTATGNIDESMGAGRGGAIPGVSAPGPRPVSSRLQGVIRSANAATIPVDRIAPDPDQPREEFEPDALERLANSLREKGQLQPIRVRWDEAADRYIIICGERRWRAANLAGLPTMQAVISEGPIEAGELLALQLIENCVREDLRPIEQAKAFRALMDRNGWSGNHLARTLGIAQPSVVRTLALLDLPESVKDRVESGDLAPGTAYEIGKLEDPAEQAEVADQAVTEGLNRSDVVRAVRERSTRPKSRGAKSKPRRTSATMRTSSGMRITFEHRKGVDDAAILAALDEAAAAIRSRLAERSEAA